MTDAEARLWFELRGHRLTDLHFRRQAPIGSYIADFVCHEAKVIVELDGEQHALEQHAIRDARRDAWFASRGYLTLRFWNHEIFQELDTVTDTVFARCAERLPKDHAVNSPLPHPPPQGGREAETTATPSARSRRSQKLDIARSDDAVSAKRTSPQYHRAPFFPLPSPLVGEGEGGGVRAASIEKENQ